MTVSVGKLREGGEAYLLNAVARGQEDYYVGSGEMPGRWCGGGAEALGLAGEVDAEQFRRVLSGCDPHTGEKLLATHRKKLGFDVAFSPPKSVSVLWALGDSEISRVVQNAHDEAVATVLGYLEGVACSVASRRGGRTAKLQLAQGEGFIGAVFRHRTSRAGDPQLHSHVVLANLARAEGSDVWKALARHPDLYRHSKAADALYQAELRRQLTEKLGIDWTYGEAHPEIVAVPEEVCGHYSTRHREALAAVMKRGLEATPGAMQAAVLSTRRAKQKQEAAQWNAGARDYGVEPGEDGGLRERWRREAVQAGLPPLQLDEILHRNPQHAVDFEAFNAELAGPHGLTETHTSFSRRDVIQAYASLPGVGALDSLRLAAEFLSSGEIVSLGRKGGGEERFSTWSLLAAEDRLVRFAKDGRDAGVAQVDANVVEAAIRGRGLSDEQAAMVRQLCSSGSALEVVVGRAGTGKTYALSAAREAWEASGTTVVGAALSAAAAGELRRGAKLTAVSTVARKLIDSYKEGLPEGCVLLLDEASMIDTRSLSQLAKAVEKANGKVILVGDPRQLPAIESGGVFARLAREIGFIELTEVRRQESVEDRQALAEIRHGDIETGLRALTKREGRNVYATNTDSQRLAMVADWQKARQNGQEVLLLARRRRRVEELAVAARAARRTAGELGDDELVVQLEQEPSRRKADKERLPPSRTYSVGDEVLFKKNTTGRWKHLREQMPGVYNGAVGTVTAIHPEDGSMTVRLRANPEAERAWTEAWARQEAEITELVAEIETTGEKLSAAKDSAERLELRRQLNILRSRAHRRQQNRARGLAEVGGGLLPRPGVEVVVDSEYLKAGHVAYGYARSIHSAQGATADSVLVDAQDLKGREAAYVALSRHRQDVKLYHVQTPEPTDVERHVEPEATVEPVSDLLSRISRSEATPTALEQATGGVWASAAEICRMAAEQAPEVLAQEADQLAAAIQTGTEARLNAARAAAEERVVEAQRELEAAERSNDRGRAWLARMKLRDAQGRLARLTARAAAREEAEEERRRLAALRAAQRRQEWQQ
jgi:conjugative relaxase-like TrwC/TraI family protein